jgi:hypothetical protein
MLFHCRVRENHVRVAVQGFKVMRGKSVALFRHNQEDACLIHQGFNSRGRQRLFLVQGFVHYDDELCQRVQPGKPRVASQELQKMIRRLSWPDRFFVGHALRFNERFVEGQQRVAEVGAALPEAGMLRRWLSWAFLLHSDPNRWIAERTLPVIPFILQYTGQCSI